MVTDQPWAKDVADAAELLRNAARGPALTSLGALAPSSVNHAYAIQNQGAAAGSVRAWKVAKLPGIDGPITAPIGNLVQTPATLPVAGRRLFGIEAEFAFAFAEDLPTDRPACAEDIIAAVGAIHPAIEVLESRFADLSKLDMLSILADSLSADSLVIGQACSDWTARDFAGEMITVFIDGTVKAEDAAINPFDLVGLLVDFAQAQRARGLPVRRGDVVTTGLRAPFATCTANAEIRVDFNRLGSVEVSFRA